MRRFQLSILRALLACVCKALSALWLAALGLLLLIAMPLSAQRLRFADSISAKLRTYAADSVEHLVCLDGHVTGDTVSIDAMREPTQIGSATGVRRQNDQQGCGVTLIVWHNHPTAAGDSAWSNLYFSLSDQNTFLRYEVALYAIVGVRGAWCMWTRDEVHAGWLLHLVPLPAIAERCWRYE